MARQPRPWRRGGGPWYAQVRGRKVRLADAGATKTQAQDELNRILGAPVERRAPETLTLRQLVGLYLEHATEEVAAGTKGVSNLKDKTWFLLKLVEACGARAAVGIQPRDIVGWLDGQKDWGHSTRALATRHVKAAFRWAELMGHARTNPLRALKAPQAKVRERTPTEAEAATLIEATDEPLRSFLAVLLDTGCRPGELARLTIDRVSRDRELIHVVSKTGRKTGRRFRPVYLRAGAAEALNRAIGDRAEGYAFLNRAGRPWTRSQLGRRVRELSARVGLGKGVVPYGFRHRYATTALERGVSAAVVATLIGHAGVDLLMRTYSHLIHESGPMKAASEQARPVTPEAGPKPRKRTKPAS